MAKPGRPKGSGRGLVTMNLRVEPDVYEGFEAWRERQVERDTGEPMSQAEAARRLIRWALEQVGTVKELDAVSAGYEQGKRDGQADWNEAAFEAWNKLQGRRKR